MNLLAMFFFVSEPETLPHTFALLSGSFER